MKRMALMTAVLAWAYVGLAADPGGVPGFVEATFTSKTLDTTSDVAANVSRITHAPNVHPTSFGLYTTVGARAYMWLEGGVAYNFRYYYRNACATLMINGQMVLSKSTSKSGSYTPSASGWHLVDLRAGSEGANGGVPSTSYYGLQWKKSSELTYCNFEDPGDGSLFKTGNLSSFQFKGTVPVVLSSAIRATDPTVLDVVYKVFSDKPVVNVRALAFEDGVRNFFNVVRPTAFVKDVNGVETSPNIGDGIAANVDHKLAWRVSNDWKTDLAKAKFEVLVSETGTLPMKWIAIPATQNNGAVTVSYGTQRETDVFNAMLWYYACGAKDLALDDGYLTAKGHVSLSDGAPLVSRMEIPYPLNALEYIYDKMDYGLLNGVVQEYARRATRKELIPDDVTIYAYKRTGAPEKIYLGEKMFCVIDVSGGANAVSYPVTYLSSAPTVGWSDEYKTKKIVLRRIEPGSFNMSGRMTTLTSPYYMGVFPVTQRQYELVTGSSPSTYVGDNRPVDRVSWNAIRGDSSTYNWPTDTTVDPNSFIGRIQQRTELALDLPTEAQWEYACRAGMQGDYNNGDSPDLLARHELTRNDMRGGCVEHTTVGLYLSNTWGLFDMHGPVYEWCLDWYGAIDTQAAISDPTGAESGSDRVHRGGGWNMNVAFSTSDRRDHSKPSSYSTSAGGFGFRLVMNLTRE